jgi:molecular chaperone GrpE
MTRPDEQTVPGGTPAGEGAASPPSGAAPVPPATPEGAAAWEQAESEAPKGAPAEATEPTETPEAPVPDEAAKYLEMARRTQADFENYRKRMARENSLAGVRGASKLAKELLPAIDHLELALKAAQGHEEIVKGFAMVHGELLAGLARGGIEAYSPDGETFDPEQHEAMAQAPIEGAESGTVIEVYQRGYRIADGAVLRPARVVVAQ